MALAPPLTPPQPAYRPHVPASDAPAGFTLQAGVLGVLFGLLFGASTVYLGLRAGLTVSASIPIAVLASSALRRLGGATILENNMVQTIGSAGESVAGGVVVTIPALILLAPYGPEYFNSSQITMLTVAGGILGVLMMVPLRRALIVKEHGVLPYPEGTVCAEVLVAGFGAAAREESKLGAGTLFSSGLIAGGSICGILFAVLVGTDTIGPFQSMGNAFPWFRAESGLAQLASGLLFLSLAAITARAARRTL